MTAATALDALRRRAASARRGQSGMVVMATLAVWMLVGGVTMLALLDMTISATNQARIQHDHAQQARAVDGALETAIAQIQIDPSGRIGQPTGKDDGSCEAGLDNPRDNLVIDDGMGNSVTVSATCWGSATKGDPHVVNLDARLAGSSTADGVAVLQVVKSNGPGNSVEVLSWSVGAAIDIDDPVDTTTTTAVTTTSTTTTTVATSTTTTTAPSEVSTTLTITAEWDSGYCANVDVTNNSKNTVKWTVQVPVEGTLYQFWNGDYTRDGTTLTVSGVDWNKSLKSGATTAFGFCSNL